ncbi:pantoate--beta-alanine ligase [Caldicellulosiruptor bescii]|uniref:Pantothenate synthetase n=2 Tax=Caldicellulosiruptor bescii TaxID=31899 RepID=PANC_CALBD|nr:pantoate--beta-alanine ligase [Caldicellulosiruptor bescii]B9ML77.1 RecName: Full=Pantothenate synthetase; Short=PS; AltName: Full=Pantoate--beta-alanine ligase; AltName: Full=Pantoate-activating enzyme [Caldicellulosiruptor bescii DSM 6725]ACM61067.1 pantoate/beta-alanine ligase [Caldicellulosiruptor bescii DSM 6725]PBC89119.1 pantoate--beta-alanine ligase [Caldicellulosiruptor bescii]PBC91399.1 pantoate--beta-alanine ligase [Caldicellulosiruptor bescii]PBD03190.1 pantoate--beta-alanine li
MVVVQKIQEMKEIAKKLKKEGKSIGFVPTMGYLHEGHLSLVRLSKQQNDITIMSIFVNPIQFGPNEDYDRYPRDFERDKSLAEKEGVDYIFYPSVEEMYPEDFKTVVSVKKITEIMCGKSRPGHFDGVATVVLKLFNIVNPDRAYFGQKDAQQLAVIKQMVKDLNLDVEIVPCPIVREQDGLAMSSRNVYLSEEERKSATVLYRALNLAKEMIEKGQKDVSSIKRAMEEMILKEKYTKIDYIEFVNNDTFEIISKVEGKVLIALAVFVGKARLIDNIVVEAK